MKKLSLLLALALLFTLTACKQKEQEPPTPPELVEEDVLRLKELRLEFPRSGLGKDQLARAMKVLARLEDGLFAIVTVGSPPASTAQALEEGHVDLAFLPGTIALDGPVVLLADAYPLNDGTLQAGSRGLLCAAPTEYGGQLDTRVSSGKPLSLAEVERTRWGTVEGDANYFALWLADSYGEAFGGTATEYDSEDALFRAAAGGEVDAIVIRDDVRVDGAETWTGDGSIWKQLPVLDVTETVYTTVAAVDPELAEGAFAQALEQVLQRMNEEHSDLMTVLGAEAFAPVTEDGLTATRHLAALVEE